MFDDDVTYTPPQRGGHTLARRGGVPRASHGRQHGQAGRSPSGGAAAGPGGPATADAHGGAGAMDDRQRRRAVPCRRRGAGRLSDRDSGPQCRGVLDRRRPGDAAQVARRRRGLAGLFPRSAGLADRPTAGRTDAGALDAGGRIAVPRGADRRRRVAAVAGHGGRRRRSAGRAALAGPEREADAAARP